VGRLMEALDVLPTFCEVTGVPIPQDRALDGASFLPIFDGKPISRKQPLYWQYDRALGWAKVAMRDGDWKILAEFLDNIRESGLSEPVLDKILERLPITIIINALALFLIIIAAVPIGVYSATHQGSLFDKASTVFVFLGFAMPTYWLALLLMMLFGVHLGWLPISQLQSVGYDNLSILGKIWDRTAHLIMPVLVSSFGGLAGMSENFKYTSDSNREFLAADELRALCEKSGGSLG